MGGTGYSNRRPRVQEDDSLIQGPRGRGFAPGPIVPGSPVYRLENRERNPVRQVSDAVDGSTPSRPRYK